MQATRILCLRNEFGTGTELTIDVEVNHGKQEPIYFRIPHDTLCLPPKFCLNHCFEMLLGVLHFLKSILRQ